MEKRFLILFVIFISLSVNNLFSADWECLEMPNGGRIGSCKYLEKNQMIIVTGTHFASYDLIEKKWSIYYDLVQPNFIIETNDKKIICGYNGPDQKELYYSTDKLKTITKIKLPAIQGILAYSSGIIYYLTEYTEYYIYKSTDFGISWVSLKIPTAKEKFYPISLASSNNGRIYVELNDGKYRSFLSEDFGESWQEVFPGNEDHYGHTKCEYIGNDTLCLKLSFGFKMSYDGGKTFQPSVNLNMGGVADIVPFGLQNEYLLIFNVSDMFIVDYQGNIIKKLTTPSTRSNVSAEIIDGDKILVGQSGGGLFLSTDTAKTWQSIGLPGEFVPGGFSIDKKNRIYAMASLIFDVPCPYYFDRTNSRWIQMDLLPNNTKCIIDSYYSDKMIAIADSQLFISEGNPNQWNKITTLKKDNYRFLSGIILMGDVIIITQLSKEALISRDFGNTWEYNNPIAKEIVFSNNHLLLLDNDTIYVSDDIGKSWNIIDVSSLITSLLYYRSSGGIPPYYNAEFGLAEYTATVNMAGNIVLMFNKGEGPFSGYGYEPGIKKTICCYISSDEGKTWKLQFKTDGNFCERPFFYNSHGIPHWIDNNFLYSTNNMMNEVVKLSDEADLNMFESSDIVSFDSDDNLYILTYKHDKNGEERKLCSTSSFSTSKSIPGGELLIYPNPAEDFIICEFESESDNTTIEIFNYLGQKVFSENYQTIIGVNTKTINVSLLAIGFYHFRINTNKEELSSIIVIMR